MRIDVGAGPPVDRPDPGLARGPCGATLTSGLNLCFARRHAFTYVQSSDAGFSALHPGRDSRLVHDPVLHGQIPCRRADNVSALRTSCATHFGCTTKYSHAPITSKYKTREVLVDAQFPMGVVAKAIRVSALERSSRWTL